MGHPCSATRTSIAVVTGVTGRKIPLFTTCYSSSFKPRILELSIRRRQSNLNTVFIFVSCEEKDSCRVVSVVELGLPAARTASKAFVGVQQLSFFGSFFLFLTPLFLTKICDIPYPIYGLTKNSKPHLWPVSVVRYNSSLVQTNVKLL